MQWFQGPLADEPPAPEELILRRVLSASLEDSVIPSVFPGRSAAWDVVPPPPGGSLRSGALPEHCIAPLTYHDIPKPGMRSNAYTIYHVLRFNWMVMEPMRSDRAALARLLRYFFRLYTGSEHFKLPVATKVDGSPLGSVVDMVTRSEPGDVRPAFDPIDQSSAALAIIIPWTYVYDLKSGTDRVLDLDSAGFYDP